MTATILILDLSTSGFNEHKDQILEVCCILLDADKLDVLHTFSEVIAHEPDSFKAPAFHAALIEECFGGEHAKRLSQVEGMLLAGPWTRADAICNRALDFDLRFLRVHMPAFAKALERKLPIELKASEFQAVNNGVPEFVNSNPRTYRASDDAIAAYEEYVYYQAFVRAAIQCTCSAAIK
jgi:oligoribonuclease (3'-5' exoribonuclease)